ncbi:hypothetical protein TIFTF001_046751 [Ficus carica]|uniref:Uncharacterized protein n=1 Tax=Ficus carica TaxID=3494 RepID=A0AA87ZV54_FICCA|nr:hypothetical protein TIFTF001_046751 [Ficus carica]
MPPIPGGSCPEKRRATWPPEISCSSGPWSREDMHATQVCSCGIACHTYLCKCRDHAEALMSRNPVSVQTVQSSVSENAPKSGWVAVALLLISTKYERLQSGIDYPRKPATDPGYGWYGK